jgi:hypothetical protein
LLRTGMSARRRSPDSALPSAAIQPNVSHAFAQQASHFDRPAARGLE